MSISGGILNPVSFGIYGNAPLLAPLALKALSGLDVPEITSIEALRGAMITSAMLAGVMDEAPAAFSRVLAETPAACASNEEARIQLDRLAAILAGIPEGRHLEALERLCERGELESFQMPVNCEKIQGGQNLAALLGEIERAKAEVSQAAAFPLTPFHRKYDILRQIGGGGEAYIYLVQEKETGALYVARCSRNPAKVEELRRETRALQNIDHPNVVRVQHLNLHRLNLK